MICVDHKSSIFGSGTYLRVKERGGGGGTSREWEDKEESGKSHGVHPRCFLMWPFLTVDLLPSFPL